MPMDHKEFVAGLDPDAKRRLTARSDAAGLRHLAGHAGLILCLGGLIAAQVPFWWLLLLPQGIAIVFLFTLQHEATHKTPFRSEALNEWVGWGAGLLIIQPFQWFRYFHLAHHKYTNLPGKDPELIAGAKPGTWPAYFWHVSGLPFWIAMIRVVITNATGPTAYTYVPDPARPKLRAEARGMLVIYALALASLAVTPTLLWVWLVPALLGMPALRLYLLAEHGRCAFVANMFENSRTTFTNRLVRFLAWNMPYHASITPTRQCPSTSCPNSTP